jgi:cytochrome c oxidase assembly protein subunit 15
MTLQSDYSQETRAAFRRIRRIATIALGVAFIHVVFGAIVRISGSGMGCGDNWPRCYGSFFPPMNRPDLIIEVSHRYLASIVSLLVLTLAIVAFSLRNVARVGGPRGPFRTAISALIAVAVTAILGGVTVKLGNTMFATVAHWILALTLLALLVMTIVRAADWHEDARGVSDKTFRVAAAAATMTAIVVVMGGVTAKYPGAPIACLSFPLCGANPAVPAAGSYIQMTHRILAILLVLHLIGTYMGVRKRRAVESEDVVRLAAIAMTFGIIQILIAGAMIGMKLPPILRSSHQAVGVAIWITTFAYAYMARAGSRPVETSEIFPEQRKSGPRKTVERISLSTREME